MRTPGVISVRSTFHQFGRFMIVLSALAMVMAMTGMTAWSKNDADGSKKVWVCKTVGDPKADQPELQSGNNPIHISRNAVHLDGEGYVFNDAQHSKGVGFVVENPEDCDAPNGGPADAVEYCVEIDNGVWDWAELLEEPADHDPTGDKCDPEPDTDTYCVYDGDDWDFVENLTEAERDNDYEDHDPTGDNCDQEPEVQTVWICDDTTGEPAEVNAEGVDEDAIVEGPGVICDDGPGDNGPGDNEPGDNGPDDTGPEDNGPDDTGPEDNGPEDNGGTDEVEEFVVVLDDDHVRSPAPETTEVLSGGELPRTGTDSLTVFALALLMLSAGGSMIALGRRVEQA